MRKLFCVLLAVILCFNLTCMASATEPVFSVKDTAVYLLNDALEQPDAFNIPDLSEENVYLCNAVNPYALVGDELLPDNNVEFFLVRTDEEFIASITLCYDDGEVISACLDTYIAEVINLNCNVNDAFQLVGQDGKLYVKTVDKTGTSNSLATVRNENTEVVANAINEAAGNLQLPTVKCQLAGIVTNPVTPRSSKLLNVPFVAQGYNTCWAAAAAAFGQYYTGSTYAHYTADDLAEMMGLLGQTADMATTKTLLSNVFHLNTTYYSGALSDSEAINLFQHGKPIIAGFQGTPGWHMVVLCGYDDHATGVDITFYIRDSNFSDLITLISYTDSNQPLTMYYYGGSMIWSEGLY